LSEKKEVCMSKEPAETTGKIYPGFIEGEDGFGRILKSDFDA
jgi:hypothetical protein